ncbi:hypothetical protein KC330_g8761 [Hortaea werneckii]|nr:hypothetical protein KC330_g8761 [Hortaea werneckii]
MAPRASSHVTELARMYLEETNDNCSAIALRLGYSKGTVEKCRLNYEVYGEVYPPDFATRGRARALTTEQAGWMIAYLDERPSAYLEELALAVFDRYGIQITGKTVSNYLSHFGWSRKVAKARAKARSLPLRALWQEKRSNWHQERLVFCDESAAANLKSGWRKYAWSPVGQDATQQRGTSKGDRYSRLPALTVDGYLPNATLIVKGSVKIELFLFWVQHTVLPLLVPGYHILVMDNCTTHHSDDIRPLCEAFSIQLENLPPYSPDLNPIETTFHTLKSWIRRNFEQWQSFGGFYEFLEAGIQEFIGHDCRPYYRNCGYEYVS